MTLVTGLASVPPPAGVEVVRVETAREMATAVEVAMPADAAVMAAAVADWRVANASGQKLKKDGPGAPRRWSLPRTRTFWRRCPRGEAAATGGRICVETTDVVAHATAKRARKGCDWIVANDVSPSTGIMGGKENRC